MKFLSGLAMRISRCARFGYRGLSLDGSMVFGWYPNTYRTKILRLEVWPLLPHRAHTHPSLLPHQAAHVPVCPLLPQASQLSHLTSLSSEGVPLPTVLFQLTSTIRTSSVYLLEEVSSTSLLTSKFKCPSPLLPQPSENPL